MNFKMRLKSCAGLFLMFQLNWLCSLIDASSSIRVVCSFDIEATNITDFYLDTCTHIILNDALNFEKKVYEKNCKLPFSIEKPRDFMKNMKNNHQLKVMLSVRRSHIEMFLYDNQECRNNKNNGTATVEDQVVDFLKEMKFDGLDINVDGVYSIYTKLLKNIKQALKRNGLVISYTYDFYMMAAEDWTIEMERGTHRLVDFINLDPSRLILNGLAHHHYPLFQNFPKEHNSRFFAIDDEIQKVKFVFEPDKIVIGIPLWSRSWKIPSNVTDTRPPVTAIGESGFVSNREICQGIQTEGWQVFYEDIKRNISPYAVSPITGSNRTWVSYDDPATVIFILKYILSNNLGGVYFDLAQSDDSNNASNRFPIVYIFKNMCQSTFSSKTYVFLTYIKLLDFS